MTVIRDAIILVILILLALTVRISPRPEPVAIVHENIWDRVVDNFALPECSEHEIALTWAQWYADHPDYMARIFKRAQPWIFYIAEELERRGMPGEIALLPIVESAYDPFAFSSGRALGAWQFIASTGRNYGLNQDWWYDGRRDVWASTDAALNYLQHMADMFDGDWLLALAGYNSGENRVHRQVKRNRKASEAKDDELVASKAVDASKIPMLEEQNATLKKTLEGLEAEKENLARKLLGPKADSMSDAQQVRAMRALPWGKVMQPSYQPILLPAKPMNPWVCVDGHILTEDPPVTLAAGRGACRFTYS